MAKSAIAHPLPADLAKLLDERDHTLQSNPDVISCFPHLHDTWLTYRVYPKSERYRAQNARRWAIRKYGDRFEWATVTDGEQVYVAYRYPSSSRKGKKK